VADVAFPVSPCAQKLRSQAQVEREIRGCLPVILQEEGGVALPVGVVVNAAAAKTELGRSAHKIAKVFHIRTRCIREEKLPIEHLREQFLQPHARVLSAYGEVVLARNPA